MNTEQLHHAGRRHGESRNAGRMNGLKNGNGKGRKHGNGCSGKGKGNGCNGSGQGRFLSADMTMAVLAAVKEHRATAADVQERLREQTARLIALPTVNHALSLLTEMGYLGCEVSEDNVYFISDAGRVYLNEKNTAMAELTNVLKVRQHERRHQGRQLGMHRGRGCHRPQTESQ